MTLTTAQKHDEIRSARGLEEVSYLLDHLKKIVDDAHSTTADPFGDEPGYVQRRLDERSDAKEDVYTALVDYAYYKWVKGEQP